MSLCACISKACCRKASYVQYMAAPGARKLEKDTAGPIGPKPIWCDSKRMQPLRESHINLKFLGASTRTNFLQWQQALSKWKTSGLPTGCTLAALAGFLMTSSYSSSSICCTDSMLTTPCRFKRSRTFSLGGSPPATGSYADFAGPETTLFTHLTTAGSCICHMDMKGASSLARAGLATTKHSLSQPLTARTGRVAAQLLRNCCKAQTETAHFMPPPHDGLSPMTSMACQAVSCSCRLPHRAGGTPHACPTKLCLTGAGIHVAGNTTLLATQAPPRPPRLTKSKIASIMHELAASCLHAGDRGSGKEKCKGNPPSSTAEQS